MLLFSSFRCGLSALRSDELRLGLRREEEEFMGGESFWGFSAVLNKDHPYPSHRFYVGALLTLQAILIRALPVIHRVVLAGDVGDFRVWGCSEARTG